ncbi:MAG TPA: copper chaperone PCu(A)C [Trebonia sp.]|nr:copper chaperone PCu(A)C [Trebonia sp.]
MRRLNRAAGLASAAVLAALAAAGCSSARASSSSSIAATAAYIQQPAGKTTVGYLDIRNNGAADELVSVTTSVGGTVEFRAPERPGVAPVVMRTVPDIPIPAHAMTQLVPDSYHLLITGAGPMHDGKDITLRLTFAHAGTITILALVTNPESGGASYFLN